MFIRVAFGLNQTVLVNTNVSTDAALEYVRRTIIAEGQAALKAAIARAQVSSSHTRASAPGPEASDTNDRVAALQAALATLIGAKRIDLCVAGGGAPLGLVDAPRAYLRELTEERRTYEALSLSTPQPARLLFASK